MAKLIQVSSWMLPFEKFNSMYGTVTSMEWIQREKARLEGNDYTCIVKARRDGRVSLMRFDKPVTAN